MTLSGAVFRSPFLSTGFWNALALPNSDPCLRLFVLIESLEIGARRWNGQASMWISSGQSRRRGRAERCSPGVRKRRADASPWRCGRVRSHEPYSQLPPPRRSRRAQSAILYSPPHSFSTPPPPPTRPVYVHHGPSLDTLESAKKIHDSISTTYIPSRK